MKQTEKLASAAYLIKKADLQETLQNAIRKVKNTFNPASDEEVLASAPRGNPLDAGASNIAKVQTGEVLGMLGGAALGNLLGRPLGGMFLKNLLRKGYLRDLGRSKLDKSNFIFREVNDPAFAQETARKFNSAGRNLGGLLGTFPGMLGGGLVGGNYALDQVKPDMVRQLREKGYPL